MDAYEATKIVFQKIQNLDPQNASKIMGFLLIQDHGDKEMIRLAFGPESLLHSVVAITRKELNLTSTPSSPNSPFGNHGFSLSRQSSSASSSRIPSPLSVTSNQSSTAVSSDDFFSPTAACNGEEDDLMDELQLQEQLSFLDDGESLLATAWGGTAGLHHRRSCSVSDICLGSDDLSGGFGWRPCLFFARGYCKNGTTCRFLHGGETAADGGCVVGPPSKFELMEQQRQRQLMASNSFPFSSSLTANKSMNVLQFLPDSPRGLMMGNGMNKFVDFGTNCVNPASRQIYLTFPADSTFKEGDVSNYFSTYGPVQDVRIPYQQKRMFGFVSFEFTETVRLILAKGNPHFVCDARVLVKPYKEKGKIPDKYRKQQQPMERGDLFGCDSPTGLESRDPFDIQLGTRMFFNNQDMLLRRKFEEQADLQEAIELQNQRVMGLRLLDVKRNSHHRTLSAGVISSPATLPPTFINHNVVIPSNNNGNLKGKEENGSIGTMATEVDQPQPTVIAVEKEKDHSPEANQNNINGKESPSNENGLHESSEHNLPDSPFVSPKATGAFSNDAVEMEGISVNSSKNKIITSPSLFSASSSLDVAPFLSCYIQASR